MENAVTLEKLEKLRGQTARFGSSILTDGTAACVQFKVLKPTSKKAVKKRVITARRAGAEPRAITGPGLYMGKDRLTGNPAHLVAIDPGIKCIITAVEHLLFGGSQYITLNAHDYDIHISQQQQ